MDAKIALRRELTARRAIAFRACPVAGAQLVDNFPSSILISDQTVVAGYMPFRTEIDVLPLMRALSARGAQIALPRVNSPSHLRGAAADTHTAPLTTTAPHPPAPSPQGGRGEALMLSRSDPEILSSFAQAKSPSHLWGGVGVGGGAADMHTAVPTSTAPHPPTPSPQGGRGGAFDRDRARRLRAAPTKAEQKLWDLLRAKRPNGSHWRRQVAVGGYIYDFGCHRLKLLIEVDGGVHKFADVQARDQIKNQVAIAHGYRLIRLQNEDVLKVETAQYFDQFAQTNSPSPLWGRVGMGGTAADMHTAPVTNTAPHPPAPSPQGGRGEALMFGNSYFEILSSFAQTNSPSPLWGRVGMGGTAADMHTEPVTSTAPHPPAPSPQGGRGEALTFYQCDLDNPSHFQKNKWGLLEPREHLPTATPTILLVPLLGFDRQGNRLGYGKGYYDATIRALKSQGPLITIGLAFAEQEVATIPTQPHDQRLDWIITQNAAYRVPS